MEIIKKMADKFPENRIALKVLEESIEMNEVLIKRETKHDEMRPLDSKLIEEMGDLLFRMDILIEKMGIRDQVKARYDEKAQEITEWFRKKHEN